MIRMLTAAVALALPLGSGAVAHADPPAPSTTPFQTPVTFVAACSTVGFQCWVPHRLVTVPPSVTTGPSGVVTFSATAPDTARWGDCLDLSIGWLNLTTGATGSTVVRNARYTGYGQPVPPAQWCTYSDVTVTTGPGTVAAVASAVADKTYDGWPPMPVASGFGVVTVP